MRDLLAVNWQWLTANRQRNGSILCRHGVRFDQQDVWIPSQGLVVYWQLLAVEGSDQNLRDRLAPLYCRPWGSEMSIRTELEKDGQWLATIRPDRTQRPFSSGS